jgi:hypothetical protein
MTSLDQGCSRATRPRIALSKRGVLVFFTVFTVSVIIMSDTAFAQRRVRRGQAGQVFDQEKKADEKKVETTDKKGPVTDRDSIGFTQENVASQMTELEERMFRLSEALRSLEPENASRLSLALKFSREELILHQMKETQKLMREAQLSKAETEVRELLAKLEHLRSLLLAEDLDFQMKLARLRQMRETLNQLERIVKEERRELTWSRTAVEQQAELKTLKNRRADLEALVRDQKKVIEGTRQAASGQGDKAAKEANRAQEDQVQKKTAGLAADPLFATLQPPYLKQADPHLGDAVSLLGSSHLDKAAEPEEKALDLLSKELARLDDRIKSAEQNLASTEFQKFERDQSRNRDATDSLGQTSARLGETGMALQKDLIRASGSMHSAEEDLAKTAAKPAADDQLAALKHLVKSREELAQALEKLLVELRAELQAKIVAELTDMHEIQKEIRESTQAQAPRIAKGSRTALLLVTGMAPKEGDLADRTDHLRALTEETEFGIALTTCLRVLSREMTKIQDWLKDGDASPKTVALEIRVEQDLLGLLEAMRRLPPTTPPPPGTPLPTEPRARERELNRLIAELKMIRLLQVRLDDDTVEIDGSRPKTTVLTPALKRDIEALKASQEEIRDSLAKIASQLEGEDDAGAAVVPDTVDK